MLDPLRIAAEHIGYDTGTNLFEMNSTHTCMYIDRLQGVVWLVPPGEAMRTAIVRIFLASLVWGK